MNRELKIFTAFAVLFLVAFYLPLSDGRVQIALLEAFKMLQWYARNHTLACVVPAMFIAGAIATFLSRQAILRHLGPRANKVEAYSVGSVSGTVLAVCSCSVLPMFAGIYRVGAGLGPASAFLYAGPALNIVAIFLTARVLGFELGLARSIAAIVWGGIIGLLMAVVFSRSERAREKQAIAELPAPREAEKPRRSLLQTALCFTALIAFLVFSDWFNPGNVTVTLNNEQQPLAAVLLQETTDEIELQIEKPLGTWKKGDKVTLAKSDVLEVKQEMTWVVWLHQHRWYFAGAMGLAVLLMAWGWFSGDEVKEWMHNTWDFAKQIVPLLFGGILLTGFVGALLPEQQVAALVGDNSLRSNLVASVLGAFMYFATLTEVPVTQALMEHGMAQGPALALLLAGPALSLPSILVMRSVWGWKKDSYVSHVDRGAGQCGRYGLRESDPRMTELLSTRGGGTTMKKIQILGTGCSKCNNLTANAETAAREAGIPYEVVKITDINEIINYGVMLTPALAVDGQVKLVGRVPSVTEMKQLLTQA